MKWQKLPDEQCYWWWWNGDENSAPVPVSILYSGSNGKYFASQGQLGWTVSQWVEQMGGLWLKLDEPEIPTLDSALGTTT